MKNISILGSTGSIGKQTLDVIRNNLDLYKVIAISGNNNIDLLLKQIKEFAPKYVAVFDEKKAKELRNKVSDSNVKILCGLEGLNEISTLKEVDILVTSVVGNIGLLPTLNAIKTGKTIALANKETLVTAGELVMKEANINNARIIPVDSEHSAIFQCLQGANKKEINKIILTASGGPFRGMNKEKLMDVKARDALKHPNWSMGRKISIDSATLMNKGLEVIEAKWLFGLEIDKIDVIIHPQSIIHSMVEFIDGSVLAQLAIPDMKLPIQYALTYPERVKSNTEGLSFEKYNELTFEKPDRNTFLCLDLAYEALRLGGTMPTVLNAANEELVMQYLDNRIKFYDIPDRIEKAMKKHNIIKNPNINDIIETDKYTREYINKSF
ncbi:1-deoxy-D-xylulose-5-phosphate reductoisomerase [Paramaledivibacter caminithermalis]|uniref:1-deoxy-D-xylulose 5-phosphate reductoisomerase n=1 Tax=Paramaledivibacter caminithermalis (strain DSM 15212 / CIP 107654 / DViRD3) TaxID=1121301 RepID=A0A1M6N5X8_PARC5|nr:1-deoxy-D-xylulose-5-phosphate reductoisomerase [Paramaledivibacter caminithermalis]SHJ91052.1 1-deoxy-D-xylulose 5-phosphate reductoisomerase [Paramaledivibacter caminithermalis DSM 15212]